MRRKIIAPTLTVDYRGSGITAQTFGERTEKPIPMTMAELPRIPKYPEMSNAFNDFNKEFRDIRFKPQTSKLQIFDTWGNGGRGNFKHKQWAPEQLGQFKVREKPEKMRVIDEENVEEQLQTDEMYNDEGQDVRGFKKTSKAKAKAEVKREMQNVNKGINSASQDKKGLYGSGLRMREYEKKQFKSDTNYKKYVDDDDEFKQINNPDPVTKGRTKDKFIESEQNQ